VSKMRFLITGATGFVGSNILRYLVKKNYSPHVFIRKTSNLWRIKDLVSKITLYKVDLTENELLNRTVRKIKPQVIFHLANAPLYQGRPALVKSYLDANLLGTINMIASCKDLDYQCFVNTGSSAEYGLKNKPMREDNYCQPLSLYAITKLAATNYASYIGKIDRKPIITFRLFSPFGAFDDPKRLVTETIYNALDNKQIFLSNSNLVRDYLYMEDVVDAYIKAIDKAQKYQGEIFNIGSGRQISIGKTVKAILKLSASKSKIKWGKLEPRHFESYVWEADLSKTKKCLSWKPRYSFEEGLTETINWFRENKQIYRGRVRTFR